MSDISLRAMSGFPLSIGTGIAMESLFTPKQKVYDEQRIVPDKPDMTRFGQAWFNLSTLFRNMAGAMSSEDAHATSEDDYAQALSIEMEVIRSLFKENNSHIQVVFYTNDYKKLYTANKYHDVLMRQDNTPMKKEYTQKVLNTLELLTKKDESILTFSSTIKPKVKKPALIVTHSAFDLVSSQRFGYGVEAMTLVESHTGAVKKITQWNTKYYPVPGSDMTILPFYAMLLYIFGDRYLIMPQPLKLRKLIMDIAVKRKWTPFTTLDKIRFDITNDVKEHFVRDTLLRLPTPA